MKLRFLKMQGVGNDFVLVDAREAGERNWPFLAARLCDRRFGIGSDGLLVVQSVPDADARMQMFNPDGTEDFCGNGLRCVARFAADHAGAALGSTLNAQRLTLATIAGPRAASIHPDGSVTVEMGLPRFEPDAIPIAAEGVQSFRSIDPPSGRPVELSVRIEGEDLELFPLSTGTTHSILFVHELPDDDRFCRISPRIERHPLFPERTSIIWTMVEDFGRLRIRIWERGVGETWGCGSGACAAAVAARSCGRTGDRTRVISRGGELMIEWNGEKPIQMTGPAEYVYEGVLSVEC